MVYNMLATYEDDESYSSVLYGEEKRNRRDEMVEVRFAGTNLADKDFLSLSDPFIVCHILYKGKRFEYVGETETVIDNINPEWMTSFLFTHNLIMNPHIEFVLHLFDEDGNNKLKLSKHDFLGMVSFQLSDINVQNGFIFNMNIGPSNKMFYNLQNFFKIPTESKLCSFQNYHRNALFLRNRKAKRHDCQEDLKRLQKQQKENHPSISYTSKSNLLDDMLIKDNNQTSSYDTLESEDFLKRQCKSSLDFMKLSRKQSKSRPLSIRNFSLPFRHGDQKQYQQEPALLKKGGNGSGRINIEYDLERATKSVRARKNLSGHLTVSIEPIRMNKGSRINFKVLSNLVVDKSSIWYNISKNPCIQFFEIYRESPTKTNSNEPKSFWNCIYRSEDGMYIDNANFINYSIACLNERQIHNGMIDRKIKLKFMSRHTKTQHALISYLEITMEDLFGLSENQSLKYKMEGEFHDDTDSIGSLSITRLHNVENEYNFVVKADHFISKRFICVYKSDQKHSKRKIRRIPKFISRY